MDLLKDQVLSSVCVWQSCEWKMVCVKVVCERERVTFTKCHACHAKRRWMSPSATPATPATQNEGSAVSATPATQNEGRSATPATWSEGGCRQVPRLPSKAKVVP